MKCRLFGNFWRGNLDRPERAGFYAELMTPFMGEIEVGDDGRFVGAVSDVHGDAEIRGTISGVMLEFTKEYTRIAPGRTAGKGLYYLLKGSGINGVHGGWWGMFTQDGEDPNMTRGQATCTIHPDPNG